MLRQFVSATAPDITQEPNANVLWIFIPNFERNLVEYYYGSLGERTIPKLPFIANSNITVSQI